MVVLRALNIPNWTLVPGFLLLLAGSFFWGHLVAMLAARFRDTRYLLPNIGGLLYFLTPVYWRYDMLKTHHWIADLNPLYAMISIVRMPLMGEYPSAAIWQMAISFVALGAILWVIFFSAFRRRIPFWV
ncbi:MAG: hypothetical protein WDN06_14310 [Asticcacaulis sp.]